MPNRPMKTYVVAYEWKGWQLAQSTIRTNAYTSTGALKYAMVCILRAERSDARYENRKPRELALVEVKSEVVI